MKNSTAVVPPPTQDECFACQCDRESRKPSTAFIAGVALALEYNINLVATRLCLDHRAALIRGISGTQDLVKPGQQRERT